MPTPWTSPAAPGLYGAVTAVKPSFAAVRMDVCAFVGIAPRGPARVPRAPGTRPTEAPPFRRSIAVAVESIAEYRRLYGGFDGPGRLPYAIHTFFAQGGRRAYVVRIVHDDGGEPGLAIASGAIAGTTTAPVALLARNEGRWGNTLRAGFGFAVAPLGPCFVTPTGLSFADREPLEIGALLRLGATDQVVLAYITSVRRDPDSRVSVTLDRTIPLTPTSAELVTGVIEIVDGDGNRERHTELGLAADHPRWAASVLRDASTLVYPGEALSAGLIEPLDLRRLPLAPVLPPVDAEIPQFSGGADRYTEITTGDFFDDAWLPGDPERGDGIAALAYIDDLATVIVPDLYVPEPLPSDESVRDPAPRGSPRFVACEPPPPPPTEAAAPTTGLDKLHLDPTVDLAEIVALQTAAVAAVERLGDLVLLLDVPPRLTLRQILRWRTNFHSSRVAAYHPWLYVAPDDDGRDRRISINPSAVAAGVLARQERVFGISHGPAGIHAVGVIDVAELVAADAHAELHSVGINVHLRERGGVRLSAARTLADDRAYRQLSVRRLMSLLRRTLEIQTQWAVFEPNTPQLRGDIVTGLRAYLRQLYRAGAFRGADESEGFFVRCDPRLNTRVDVDGGRMIIEIGVAPTEPLEFIVLRLVRSDDGTLAVET